MLHDRIRFPTGADLIDVYVKDSEHAVAKSTRYQERCEPFSEPEPEVHDWYLGRAEQLLRLVNDREERYLTESDRSDGSELSDWALTIAHGARGLSVVFDAREEMKPAALRFRFVSQRASELLTIIRSYEPQASN